MLSLMFWFGEICCPLLGIFQGFCGGGLIDSQYSDHIRYRKKCVYSEIVVSDSRLVCFKCLVDKVLNVHGDNLT